MFRKSLVRLAFGGGYKLCVLSVVGGESGPGFGWVSAGGVVCQQGGK
jgi:hypothetical protein